MDSDTVRPIVLALLCVLAIGVAAATLDSAVETDSGGGFGVGQPAPDPGVPDQEDPDASLGGESGEFGAPLDFPCYPVLTEWWAIAGLVGGFLGGAALAYRRAGPLGAMAYVGPVGFPLLFAHALLTTCTTSTPEEMNVGMFGANDTSLPSGGSGAPGTGTGTTLTDPSVLLLVGLGVALAAAVALLFVSSGGNDPDPVEDSPDPDSSDVAAVGRAAGAAADRIEDATDVTNEVYRAWREMTDHLAVANPRSSTPAEFAAAAVEAGMDPDDVGELTALFEEVRYGGEAPTDDRERRALDALRRIEDQYADGEGGEGARGEGRGENRGEGRP
ncbi:DUF4129 domain-containing protein [Halorussus salilacus]|uniref:DUF4129 domain-containing protein n=1 Tax=Halorussus salilacus TaxID=2953750 RepID=UPI00209E6460|nr:DUF4129 domain-containing protein [Halorussus salilacus]USZ69208.1 DUF4129 domain-containing protein [Halorussus salilacus]